MSRPRRDNTNAGAQRSAAERERARLEREARRRGGMPQSAESVAAPDVAPAGPAGDQPSPESPHEHEITIRRPSPLRPVPAPRDDGVRRIQPQPPAPPAAPAGALDDETERPIGIRRVRRPSRPIVTPPGDTPSGPAMRRRRVSARARIGGLLAIAVLAVIVVGALLTFQPFGSAEGAAVRITIPQGASTSAIAHQLANAGVVDSAFFFEMRARLSGKRGDLGSGPHLLHKDMTYGSAIAALSARAPVAKVATINVTIPEGKSRREIAPIAGRAGLQGSYLDASKRFAGALNPFRYGAPKGTRSLEGFLFPATYQLDRGAPARDLVDRQLAAFRQNFATVDLARAHSKNLTGYDVLIIASMVEREAQLPRERPLIAAVIYNRLKDHTPLGIDSTTRYELNKPSGALTESDLAIDSPYNTRTHDGLPPTPIGNPGLASIRAAAAPANVPYRYFVVKPGTCGEHVFATTLAEHNRNVARYGAARARAGDKSPTTC
jgi:uncharacterized YceG family protein